MKAVWEDEVLAESDETVDVEGNHYFPRESVRWELFEPSDKQTTCPWKDVASYYQLHAGEKTNADAAWHYPEPKEAAQSIRGRVAFWRGVKVSV